VIVTDASWVVALRDPADAHHPSAVAANEAIGDEPALLPAVTFAECLVAPSSGTGRPSDTNPKYMGGAGGHLDHLLIGVVGELAGAAQAAGEGRRARDAESGPAQSTLDRPTEGMFGTFEPRRHRVGRRSCPSRVRE
jgi:hypothetical protein